MSYNPTSANGNGNWLDSSNTSNRYIQMYVKGFVDVSGGNVVLRPNSHLIMQGGDISLNGNLYAKNMSGAGGSGTINIVNPSETATFDSNSFAVLSPNANYGTGLGPGVTINGTTMQIGNITFNNMGQDANGYGIVVPNNSQQIAFSTSNVNINGNLTVGGNLNTNSTTGNVNYSGNLRTYGNIVGFGDASLNGNLSIGGNLNVGGTFNVNNFTTNKTITTTNYQLIVSEDISLNGRIMVSGNVGIGPLVAAPQYALDVSGAIQSSNPSTGTFNNFYGKVPPNNTISPTATVTPNTTNAVSSTWTNNGVTWTASANTQTSSANAAYVAFNNQTTDTLGGAGWQTNDYSAAYTGSATTTVYKNSTPTTVTGDWLQLQTNVPLIMNSYTMTAAGYNGYSLLGRCAAAYTIAGSNDGNTWYDLQDVAFTSLTSSGWSTTATASTTLQTCNSFAVSTATGNLSYANVTTYTTQSNAYTYFRFILLKTLNGSFSTAGGSVNSQFQWTPVFSPSTAGPSRTLLYMDATNINQLDVSGSLALVNSNPSSMIVTPVMSNPTSYVWNNNNVTWSANASSYNGTYYPYNAFNNGFLTNTTATGWLSGGTNYNTSTGAYNTTGPAGTSVNVGGSVQNISGDWLQIQSSIPVVMKNYYLGTQYNCPGDLPKTYTIAGSNDGATWYDLQDATFTAWPGNLLASNITTVQITPVYAVSTATTSSVNNNNITSYSATQSNTYTYFRLIIKTLCNGQFSVGGSFGQARGFWNPTFTPASSAVSLALDAATPNQLNIGGSLGIAGGITPLYSTPSFGPGQVGYIYTTTNSSAISMNNGAETALLSLTGISVGVYIVEAHSRNNIPVTNCVAYLYLRLNGTTTTNGTSYQQFGSTAYNNSLSLSTVVSVGTANSTFSSVGYTNRDSVSYTYNILTATRIA